MRMMARSYNARGPLQNQNGKVYHFDFPRETSDTIAVIVACTDRWYSGEERD